MKDTKHVRRDYYSVAWVMPQGWDLGVPRGSNIFLFKHGHVACQIYGDDEQNLGRSKGQISLKCQFRRFLYQTLCLCSQIKDRKHMEQNFHSVAKVMPQGGTAECWWSQKL